MDNELRKKRVLEGIKLLENGIEPLAEFGSYKLIQEYLGISKRGWYVLECNGMAGERLIMEENGFIDGLSYDLDKKLHNWKRFYELIEKL